MSDRHFLDKEFPGIARQLTRRNWLKRAGGGLGALGLATLLHDEGLLRAADSAAPLRSHSSVTSRGGHVPAKVKSVIWLFMNGGPSQVDTFEYKPELNKHHGQELPGYDVNNGFFPEKAGPLMGSSFEFRRHGQCGRLVSEIFPHMAKHVDKMAFLHACHTESNNHSPALFMMNTGMTRMGFPCVGSWVTYGLGSETRDLPGFVVMSDPLGRGLPKGEAQNWGTAFLPKTFQGTPLRPKGIPILNMNRPEFLSDTQQRRQLSLLEELNGEFLARNPAELELEARIESFELAYRMQEAAPEVFDVSGEADHIGQLYGLDNPKSSHFGRQCLLARRMIERGVRFVQVYSGGTANENSWDGHVDIVGNHRGFAAETDLPIGGLLTDLQQRGLLEETLVIWGGEFGRLPVMERGEKPGRDHNSHAFTMWMAGGGIQGGVAFGKTDAFGFKGVEERVSVNDIHATVLHLLGIDHKRLTYRHDSRDVRLTDVAGHVVDAILA